MNIHPEMLKQLKAYYASGSRVVLERMNDQYTKLKPGDRGTVKLVDDIGTIHVNWDCGSTLGVVFGEDAVRILESGAAMTEIVKQQILSIRASGVTNMFDTVAVQRLAFDNGYYELVDFIENDRKTYARFILTGESEETP